MNIDEMAHALYGDVVEMERPDPENVTLRSGDGHGEALFTFEDGSRARVYIVPVNEDGWPIRTLSNSTTTP